jgi:hypothetical protein
MQTILKLLQQSPANLGCKISTVFHLFPDLSAAVVGFMYGLFFFVNTAGDCAPVSLCVYQNHA